MVEAAVAEAVDRVPVVAAEAVIMTAVVAAMIDQAAEVVAGEAAAETS